MEFLGALAPIAFVFAIAAHSHVAKLKKEIEELRAVVEELRGRIQ